ncbi:unnamed protein product [Dracunculus medinensis]|uniref:ELMO domain-containing protein n=1 Tax=Dracunculus medinensis TaxID=318479 RepID=A0A0N4U7S9_DRAME|nr:unnamed protein product [Dracunculus medinensis]
MSSNFHTSSKPLKEVDIRPPENTVKGAVKLDPSIGKYVDEEFGIREGSNMTWTYVTFDKQNEVLNDLITRLSVELKLPQAEKNLYALRFEDRENDGAFLTNENRRMIRQGFMLILTASPERYALFILSRLRRAVPQQYGFQSILSELIAVCGDIAFAVEFHRLGGIKLIFEMIESGLYSDDVSVQSQLLQALLILMDHSGLFLWTDVSDIFIAKIAENITGRAKQEDNTLLLSSLSILDLILNSKSESKMVVVLREVPFESLIRHLEKSDERVLLNVLTLMNSLYNKASSDERSIIIEHLLSKPFRLAIENSVLRKCSHLDVGIEQQLITVQRIQFNKLAQKAMRQPSDADIERIMQLKIFNAEISRSPSFENVEEIRADWSCFMNAPPGVLALELIIALAAHHLDSLTKINMENSMRIDGHSWSFPVVTFHLVNMLIDILHIIKEPEEGDRLYVMLFKSDRPFIDLFAVMIRLFHRTWYEMNASDEDIKKVSAIVRKQMDICLRERPETIEKLEELLIHHSYSYMQKLWDGERSAKEAEELQSDAVKELRKHLRPSIVDLIKKNRKNALKNGYTFGKLSKSKSLQKGQQFWHWKLDSNEKTFLYTDCATADGNITADPLTTVKVAVSEIQKIATSTSGDLLLASPKGKKSIVVRGLMLEVGDKPEVYYLVTSDEQIIDMWADGFNALIGVDHLSTEAEQQVDRFLNIELKMRLLHLDRIPNSFQIPPLPSNFDWISSRKL